MKVLAGLLAGLIAGTTAPPALSWEGSDRGAYNNKMALLGVLLESAQQRAGGDLQTLCLLLSIGNDVTERYVETNPEDAQVQQRLLAIHQDLSVCLDTMGAPTSASRL